MKSFHPLLARWFAGRFGAPTDVQLRAWQEISRGRHVLVTAPTGSGKTLAAFLWAIDRLATGAWPRGETRILYVSPLKALNNDVRKNLLVPLQELETAFRAAGVGFPAIAVQTRSGDTPGSERQRMLRRPPEILITTPESLNILLASASGRHLLGSIETVILDEIHAVAGTKRGTHLITAVDRLVPLCGDLQRIALSATVRPLDTVADFVGGFVRVGEEYRKREVAVVRGDQAKEFRVEVRAPEEERADPDEELWPRLAREFRRIIAGHRSTLLFANSRRTTERITRLINEAAGEEIAWAHHGSLSKEIRLAVEEKLKRGELQAIVATSSLELGIDIGRLDSVVLIQPPGSVAAAIQRIGRSGHGVGEVSRGLLFPVHGMDFVASAAMAAAIGERDLEPLRPVEGPLDLLAQIVLAMTLAGERDLDELYAFLKTSWPYRELPRRHFDLVIRMLEGGYADSRIPELRPRASVDRLANTIAPREGTATLVYLEGGTIPDRGYFDLRLKESGAKIGELDEEFVWERRIGETFSLGAQVWQIVGIGHNAVEVIPARRPQQVIPFWRAEELDRDFHFSARIAGFLEQCNARLDSPGFPAELAAQNAMAEAAAEALAGFLRRQREATGTELPHRHHLLAERCLDAPSAGETEEVILHTLWGNRVNRPFTLALAAAWEEEHGTPLQAFHNNDAVALLLPRGFEIRRLLALVPPERVEPLLRSSLEKSGYFGARFRENAGRALLLPKASFRKRMPLWMTRLRARKLLAATARYRDFPVLLETWRSCLRDDFDLPALETLLTELREGAIPVTETTTAVPSPFAAGLIWQQTNRYVYEDDTPVSAGSALASDLIREVAFSPHLRPRIPAELVRLFEAKRQRTAPGYAPEPGRELVDWVKERLLIPLDEWERLVAAMVRDHGVERGEVVAGGAARLARVVFPGGAPLVAAVEMLGEIAAGFGLKPEEIAVEPLAGDERLREELAGKRARVLAGPQGLNRGDEPVSLLGEWLAFSGPVTSARVGRTLGIAGAPERLRSLEEEGRIVVDSLTEGAAEPEICDTANLESLLRLLRRSRQPAFEALELRNLPLFLASFQGLTEPGRKLEDLRRRLEQLLGLPLSAGAWEEEIFPARMAGYSPAWLDSLMQGSDLAWFGCGERRLSFSFPEELGLFREGGEGAAAELSRLIPDPRGSFGFSAIRAHSGLPAAELTRELWRLAWRGELTSDSFATVRKGVVSRFAGEVDEMRGTRPRGRWQAERSVGSWRPLPAEPEPADPLAREEANRERVRILLDRYGILFRELLQRELPPLQWPRLFRTLRTMELSGELLSGLFFHGIPGLQFVSHEAYRALVAGLPDDAVWWVNAADPASLCGAGLEGLREELPPRIPGTHLVYRGADLVVVSRRFGRDLRITVPPEDPRMAEYLGFLRVMVSREFNPRPRVSVERINGLPARQSPYRPALAAFGFQESYRGLELWKRYS